MDESVGGTEGPAGAFHIPKNNNHLAMYNIRMEQPVNGHFVMPDSAVTHFHLREGDIVADFGAGSGFFLPALSKAVTDNGRVYACEIQKALVEKIGDVAHTERLGNVHPLWCDLEEAGGIKIANSELDAGVLVNTLFQIEDKQTAVAEMARTVRKGGKFFVIDWTESFAGMGPQPGAVIGAEEATNLLEASGFVLETEFPAGGHHYGLAFRKS